MKDAVNANVKSLIEMWSKAFGSETIMERKLWLTKSDWQMTKWIGTVFQWSL